LEGIDAAAGKAREDGCEKVGCRDRPCPGSADPLSMLVSENFVPRALAA
jgi:hypothetical protein